MKVFGEFEFDERTVRLRRGGETVALKGQCLDLLVLMLDRPGELITREEIGSVLWPGSAVDFGHSLDVLISRLRTALGDSSKNERYIQTVPRKGYRFAEPVKITTPASASPSVLRSRAIVLGRYAAVAILAAVLAVVFAHTRYPQAASTSEKSAPPAVR